MLSILAVILGISTITSGFLLSKERKDHKKDNSKADDLSASLVWANKENGEIKESLESITKEAIERQVKICELDSIIEELNSTISRMANEIAEKDSLIASMSTEMDKKEQTIVDLKTAVNAIQNKITEIEKASIDIEAQHKNDRECFKIQLAEKDELISKRSKEIDDLFEKKEHYKKSYITAKMQLGQKVKATEKHNSEINDLKETLSDLNDRKAKIAKEKEESETYNHKLQKEINDLKLQLEQANKSVGSKDVELELESTISQLQEANEKLSEALSERDRFKAISEKRWNTINELEMELAKSKCHPSYIQEQIIKSNDIEKIAPNKEDNIINDSHEIIDRNTELSSKKTQPSSIKTTAISNADEITDEDIDLPPIEGIRGEVKRSILTVIDLEAPESESVIDADAFFMRDPEDVELTARRLTEADMMGVDLYVCAYCGKRVKISKRDFGWRESLFFSHCNNDIVCDWKKEYSVTAPSNIIYQDENQAIEGVITKYRQIKNLIIDSLQTEKSVQEGISEVAEGKVLRGHYNYLHWRRAGIYAKYREREIVFELQTKSVLLNTIANKDMFYRLNNYHVIWVFGGDEGNGYDYITKHVHQNTMFANKRNVFIMDKEAMSACEERKELVLKCNYLDPDNKWHYRKATTGSNGILITLADLQFDEESCKPYFFDANTDYFKSHPRMRKTYENSLIGRKDLLNELQKKYIQSFTAIDELRHRTIQYNRDSTSHLINIPGISDRIIYYDGKKYGLLDDHDKIIIRVEYDEIIHWTDIKYLVRKQDLWGIITESGRFVLPIQYLSISTLKNGIAIIKDGGCCYEIDSSGKIKDSKIYNLDNKWDKYRRGNKCGIRDRDGNDIVPCRYDEIGSFRGRLVGFINGTYQKLTQRCEYKIPIQCKCIRMDNGLAVYVVGHVEAKALQKKEETAGLTKDNMYLANIDFISRQLYVNDLTDRNKNKKYGNLESDNDFTIGAIYRGVVKLKNTKERRYISFPDGRQTYISKSTLTKAGISKDNYPKIGDIIKLKKIGFDTNYDKTLWEIIV